MERKNIVRCIGGFVYWQSYSIIPLQNEINQMDEECDKMIKENWNMKREKIKK